MKVRVVRDRWAALVVLSRRVLPSSTAISKVTALLKRFDVAHDAIEKRKKEVLTDPKLAIPEGWGRESLPVALGEARQLALDLLDEESVVVKKVPDQLRLTADDMPKVLKREGGEENVGGLAEIKKLLGGLYVPSEDEKKLIESAQPEGEEPDEYVPAPTDERAPAHAES